MNPPFFMDIKSARHLLSNGNIGRAILVALANKGQILFSMLEFKEFEDCPICNWICSSYKSSFAEYTTSNSQFQCDVHNNCATTGVINKINQLQSIEIIKKISCCQGTGATVIFVNSNRMYAMDKIASAAAFAIASIDDFIDHFTDKLINQTI